MTFGVVLVAARSEISRAHVADCPAMTAFDTGQGTDAAWRSVSPLHLMSSRNSHGDIQAALASGDQTGEATSLETDASLRFKPLTTKSAGIRRHVAAGHARARLGGCRFGGIAEIVEV